MAEVCTKQKIISSVSGLVYQRYRRFFFDQIQAIQVRPTRRLYYAILANFAIIAALVFAITYGFTVPIELDALPVKGFLYGFLVAPFALYGVVQLIRLILFGASQEVTIQTAVQRIVIPPLGYRRRSRSALKRMCECVETAQGKSTKASLRDALEAWGETGGQPGVRRTA